MGSLVRELTGLNGNQVFVLALCAMATGREQSLARVLLTEGFLDIGTDGVEFERQVLDIGVGQMSERRDVGNRHAAPSAVVFSTLP